MSTEERNDDQFVDLLIKQATEGLSPAESVELRQLAQTSDIGAHEMEDTIAALSVALIDRDENLPDGLRERIIAAASAGGPPTSVTNVDAARSRSVAGSRVESWANAGWWAAAASLLLALAGWWPRLVPSVEQPVANMTPLEERQELLASGRAIRASWSPTAVGEALVGDVVFDPVSQRGFLTFRGIPPNDPRLSQYQLWIVDAQRKQPEPVDGGVFDVAGKSTATQDPASGDVVIAFEAKLSVGQPAAFVVTAEQPGGVVISKQERVLALAKVGAT